MLDQTRRLLAAADGTANPVVMASVFEAGPLALIPGARILVERSGDVSGSLGDGAIDAFVTAYATEAFDRHAVETLYVTGAGLTTRTVAGATAIYLEVVEHRPVFLVVGGGHVGRSVAHLAKFLGYYVAVIDDREDFADPEKLPDADEVICEDFVTAIDRFPIASNTAVVLVTRGHKQDELSLRRCLGRGAAYLGMIGSKRRTGAVLQHLTDEGFDAAELAKIRTPIGLDIGAESPEEIAVSILAEVMMLKHGGAGAPMYHRTAHLRSG